MRIREIKIRIPCIYEIKTLLFFNYFIIYMYFTDYRNIYPKKLVYTYNLEIGKSYPKIG